MTERSEESYRETLHFVQGDKPWCTNLFHPGLGKDAPRTHTGVDHYT